MPRPRPGQTYTIVEGDTLSGIALRAFGRAPKWRDIWAANQSRLRSGNPHLIYPGEIIVIPGASWPDVEPQFAGRDPEQGTFVIDGYELPCVTAATITRTYDSPVEGWRLQHAIIDDVDFTAAVMRPYAYQPFTVGLGERKAMEGRVYCIAPQIGAEDRTIELVGYTRTADMVDSCRQEAPYTRRDIALLDWVNDLGKPYAVTAAFDGVDSVEDFTKVSIGHTEKIGTHVQSLAERRNVWLGSDGRGGLLLRRSSLQEPVANLRRGHYPLLELSSPSFDGRKRFQTYKAVGKHPKRRKLVGFNTGGVTVAGNDMDALKRKIRRKTPELSNDSINVPRHITVGAAESSSDSVKERAHGAYLAGLLPALTLNAMVLGWYHDTGLWEPGQQVYLEDPDSMIAGMTFMIRTVEYSLQLDRRTAQLELVPWQAYAEPGTILEVPWK